MPTIAWATIAAVIPSNNNSGRKRRRRKRSVDNTDDDEDDFRLNRDTFICHRLSLQRVTSKREGSKLRNVIPKV